MTKGRFVPSSTACDVDGRIVRFAVCVQLSQSLITAAEVSATLPFCHPERSRGTCSAPFLNATAKGEGLKAAELLDREAHHTSAPVRDDKKGASSAVVSHSSQSRLNGVPSLR